MQVSPPGKPVHGPPVGAVAGHSVEGPVPEPQPAPSSGAPRHGFRIGAPDAASDSGRIVERIRDVWGRGWGVVVAERQP